MSLSREDAEKNLTSVWNLIQTQARPKVKKTAPRQITQMLFFEWKDAQKDLATQCALVVRIEKALIKAGFKKSTYDRFDHSHQYKHSKMKLGVRVSSGRGGVYIHAEAL